MNRLHVTRSNVGASDTERVSKSGRVMPAVPVLRKADGEDIQPLGFRGNRYHNVSSAILSNPIQQKPSLQTEHTGIDSAQQKNDGGLPIDLKMGIERLSGYSMDAVKVHYNSDQPAKLQALAYAQGTDIYVGPGQEKHLPHEAWHIVQQARQQVKATAEVNGKAVNDNPDLEKEADMMGANAVQLMKESHPALKNDSGVQTFTRQTPVVQRVTLATDKLNVVGEDHGVSKPIWQQEYNLSVVKTGSRNFWLESMFKLDWSGIHQDDENKNTRGADPMLERVRYIMAKFATKLETAFTNLDFILPAKTDDTTHSTVQQPETDINPLDPELEGMFKTELRNAMLALKKGTTDLYSQIDNAITEELHKHLHYLKLWNEWPDTKIKPAGDIIFAAKELDDLTTAALILVDPKELEKQLTLIAHKGKELHDHFLAARWIPDGNNDVIDSPGKAADDAKEERSYGMHMAANKNHSVPGVWKIGEQHVLDIRRFLSDGRIDAIDYNLLSMSEFRQIYDEYYSATVGEKDKDDVKQLVAADHVIQFMYEDAEDDIDMLLCAVLQTFNNEEHALKIAGMPELENVTDEDLKRVTAAVLKSGSQSRLTLKAALEANDKAFAGALLLMIASPEKLDEESIPVTPMVDDSAARFETLIENALKIHVPFVGEMIDQAQERARHSGKKLLVIVGEGHDDPYSRVMVTMLVGAMQRLKIRNFYIESTPDLVTQHVKPYKNETPTKDDESDVAHRQHFYHHLYRQGVEIIGVDVDKANVASSENEVKEQTPGSGDEQRALRAEENVKRRDIGIAKTVSAHAESGVMLVGLSHLAGLAANEDIKSVYEIVTISTMLTEDAKSLNKIAYGRVLGTTDGLTDISNLYVGDNRSESVNVKAKDAYAIAEKMIIKVNLI